MPKDQGHSHPASNSPEEKASKCHVYLESGIQVDISERLRNDIKASNQNADTHNKKQRLLVTISACATILATFFVGWQGYLLRSQLHVDQRAWVTIQMATQEVPFELNQPIRIPVVKINSGKTPARKIRGDFVIAEIQNGRPVTFQYPEPYHTTTTGVLMPNAPPRPEVVVMTSPDAVSIANPGGVVLYDQAMNERHSKQETFFVIYGRVTYVDYFDVSHWTHFCAYITHGTRWQYTARNCTDYNDADTN